MRQFLLLSLMMLRQIHLLKVVVEATEARVVVDLMRAREVLVQQEGMHPARAPVIHPLEAEQEVLVVRAAIQQLLVALQVTAAPEQRAVMQVARQRAATLLQVVELAGAGEQAAVPKPGARQVMVVLVQLAETLVHRLKLILVQQLMRTQMLATVEAVVQVVQELAQALMVERAEPEARAATQPLMLVHKMEVTLLQMLQGGMVELAVTVAQVGALKERLMDSPQRSRRATRTHHHRAVVAQTQPTRHFRAVKTMK